MLYLRQIRGKRSESIRFNFREVFNYEKIYYLVFIWVGFCSFRCFGGCAISKTKTMGAGQTREVYMRTK